MGKAPKSKAPRHDPLAVDIDGASGNLRTVKRGAKKNVGEEDEEQEYIDADLSRKILQMAKSQREEIEGEENDGENVQDSLRLEFDSEDSEEYAEEDYEDYEEYNAELEGFEDEEENNEDPDADALFEKYFSTNKTGTNLADKIMEKIKDQEMKHQMKTQAPEGAYTRTNDVTREAEGVMLPPKVIATYEKVGELLSRYKSGKLPKVFKIIPSLRNWTDILYVTNPEMWSPNAVYEATRLFVSNLKAKQAEKFIRMVLLPRFRDDIEEKQVQIAENGSANNWSTIGNKKIPLNYHIYRSLKKALYKPEDFFRGFVFPLLEDGCTVKEATIVASVLAKVSIPSLHSSAALMRLTEMEYSPACSLFIRVLINKRYALPYKVVDNLVFYFMRFRAMPGVNLPESEVRLPVVWHKSFLVFAQRYKNAITEDQRDMLLETVRTRGHHAIGPEIRRELLSGVAR